MTKSQKNIHVFLESIHKQIKQTIAEKIVHLGQDQLFMMAQKNVEEEVERDIFNVIEQMMNISIENCQLFYQFLSQDSPELYQQVIQIYGNYTKKLNEMPAFQDLAEMNSVKLPEELLQNVYSLGIKWFSSENYDKAFHYFSFLCGVIAERAQVWLLKGMCEQNLRKFEEACHSFETCVTINPNLLKGYLHCIECLILSQHPNEARTIYDTFLREVQISMYANDEQFLHQLNKIKNYFESEILHKSKKGG